ncbi:MAG: hypothetical protein AB1Z57_04135 [Acidimicrobiia bacterium]
MTGPARLEIDATDDGVVVARAFVSGVLRSREAPEDDIASARLAVSELVTAFVREDGGRLVITVPEADLVEIVGERPPTPDDIVLRIASSVAGVESTPGGFRIRVGGP